jgi:mitochondrial splicing suppressor protein 51
MARNSSYLDGLQSEEMVMDQLVDAYRLRVEDERVYCGRLRGRYNTVDTTRTSTSTADGADNQALQYALQDFQDFLDLAESESRNKNNEERHDDDNENENAYDDEDTSGGSSSPSSSTTMNTDTDNSSSSSPPSTSTIPTNETTKQNKDTTILPQWWTAEKRALCEARALDRNGDIWSNLGRPAGKDDILNHYQDNLMPMKLRMLAERVYGSDVMGQSRL